MVIWEGRCCLQPHQVLRKLTQVLHISKKYLYKSNKYVIFFLEVWYLNFFDFSSIHRIIPVLCIVTQQGILPMLRKPPQIIPRVIIQIIINNDSQFPMLGRMLIPDATQKDQGPRPHHLSTPSKPRNLPTIMANSHKGMHQVPIIVHGQPLVTLSDHNKCNLFLRFKPQKWRHSILIKYNKPGNTSNRPSNTSSRPITRMRNSTLQLQTRSQRQPNRHRCLKCKLTTNSVIMRPR